MIIFIANYVLNFIVSFTIDFIAIFFLYMTKFTTDLIFESLTDFIVLFITDCNIKKCRFIVFIYHFMATIFFLILFFNLLVMLLSILLFNFYFIVNNVFNCLNSFIVTSSLIVLLLS